MRRLVVIVMLAACGDDADESTDLGPPEPRVQQGMTRNRSHQEMDKSGYPGVLVPRGVSDVIAPFTSTVTKFEVKLGDHVSPGQRLVMLDDRPLREELVIATATLKANQAAVAQAEVEQRAAVAVLDREVRAFQDGMSSQLTVTNAELKLRKAETSVARVEAAVDEQRARIAQLRSHVSDIGLLAPIDGRVALLYVREGHRVDQGRPVIRVISSEELFVKFAIPTEMAGTLVPGDAVDVRIDPFSITVHGVVRHVAPEIDPVAKMILADADLVASPVQLQSGIDCRIVPRPSVHK